MVNIPYRLDPPTLHFPKRGEGTRNTRARENLPRAKNVSGNFYLHSYFSRSTIPQDIVGQLVDYIPHSKMLLKKSTKFVFLFHLHVRTFQHMYFFLFSIIFRSSSTPGLRNCDGGQHGYDSLDENMRVKELFLFLCTHNNHVMCSLRDSLCSLF